MSELLAAIPRLFSMNRVHDYAHFVERARANELATRATESTQRQMMDAYLSVINRAEKTSHTNAAK